MEKKFIETASRLYDVQKKIKFLKTILKQESATLQKLCDGESRSIEGYSYNLITRLGSVKYKDIEVLREIDLDQYRGSEIKTWKLTYDEQFNDLL